MELGEPRGASGHCNDPNYVFVLMFYFGCVCLNIRTLYCIYEGTESERVCIGMCVCMCHTLVDRKRLQCTHADLTSAACSHALFLFSLPFALSDTHTHRRTHTQTHVDSPATLRPVCLPNES